MSTADAAVCMTFQGAIEAAIDLENQGFRHYLQALRTSRNPAAQAMLRDIAREELEHRHRLECALIEGAATDDLLFSQPVPTLGLDYLLARKALSPDSDVREVLVDAIHREKEACDFYRHLATACSGAPMASLFTSLGNDEARHLHDLEKLYEEHFLCEN